MNWKNISLLILVFSILSGCKKFLDQKPISSLVQEAYYSNTSEVETGVISCYDGLQQVYDIEYKTTEVRSDNNGNNALPIEGDWGAVIKFIDAPSTYFNLDFWQRSYNVIARCNLVLQYLDNVEDPVSKNYFEGEAKFIRSLMYFNLVRLYGEVPLITSSIKYNDTEKFKRVPVAQVYDQIKTDLQTAMSMLPASWTNAQGLARVNKYAAQALAGKVYLTLKDWANAKSQLEPLATGSTYQLMPSFSDVFDLTKEMNKEIIFSVRYKSNSGGEGNTFSYIYTANGDARYIRGAASYLALFVTADSVRKRVTFSTSNALCGKFLDPTAPKMDAGNDFPVIRFADVLLMYAEALNEIDAAPTDANLIPLNKVRQRAGAGLSLYTALGNTQVSIRDAIDRERRLEFGFENSRWYDIARKEPAVAATLMNNFLTEAGYTNINVQPYRILYPIPQNEIDLGSGVLTQNPGY